MNMLIVYSTHDGQTEKIAHYMAERMRAQSHRVDVMDVIRPRSELSVDRYEAIVIGAPVRMGKYSRAVIRFVRSNRARLEQVRSAFFSVCMAAADNDTQHREAEIWPARFFEQTGWHPRLTAIFAGALRYSQYNWFVRWVMKRISKSKGVSTDTSQDHEYTDWTAVARFADSVVGNEPQQQ